jgi:hypothetical protein
MSRKILQAVSRRSGWGWRAGVLLELEFSAEIWRRLLKNGIIPSWIVLGLESCQVVAGSFPGGFPGGLESWEFGS